jgi:hypothetical protein
MQQGHVAGMYRMDMHGHAKKALPPIFGNHGGWGTEQEFTAKMQCVHLSIVSLTDI